MNKEGALRFRGFYVIVSTGTVKGGRREVTFPPKGVPAMRITLHIGRFTVTVIVKSRNRHPGR